MRKPLLLSLRLLLAISVMAPLFPAGKAEILDPQANHPLLRRIAADLDRQGIDVVQNWRSRVPVSTRPVVAPLANYQTSLVQREAGWIRDFRRGATGAVAAVRSTRRLDAAAFRETWGRTPKSQRVFISFAREDLAYARGVKASLEANGYVAFIYINSQGGRPTQPPALVGEYLRTAGTHLVIDTEIARRKPGVLAEALALAASHRRPPPEPPGVADAGPRRPRRPGPGDGGAAVESRRHVVEIYGAKKRCARTRQAIQLFRDAGAVVKYYDVDASPRAARVVARNTQWLAGGDTLPFIKLDGRPVHATREGIGKALQACGEAFGAQ